MAERILKTQKAAKEQRKTDALLKKALEANIENPNLYSKSQIDYYKDDGLVPISLQVSSRFVSILFEPKDGEQEFHVVNRFTHDLVTRVNLSQIVFNFFLYDPLDCAKFHSNTNPMAKIILVLAKKDENDTQRFATYTVEKKSRRAEYSQPHEGGQWVHFAAVSSDLKYGSMALLKDLPQSDYGGNPHYKLLRVLFLEIHTKEILPLGQTKGVDVFNPNNFDAQVVFINDQAKALVAYMTKQVDLVDIKSGDTLSSVPITGSIFDLVYFLDVQQYCLVCIDESTTFSIKIDEDDISLNEESPIAYFNPRNSAGLCTAENPYNYSMKSINGSYNKSQKTGFIVNQKFFNLEMQDLKISRLQVLPGVKTFYAIKTTAPFTSFVMDLCNLDIQYQATIIDIPEPIVHSYSENNSTELVIGDKHMKKTLVSPHIKAVKTTTEFLTQHLPNIDPAEIAHFQIRGKYIILKQDVNVVLYNLVTRTKLFEGIGIDIILSDDESALILNQGGFQYSVYNWIENRKQYELSKANFKNVILRMDFLPGCTHKVALYDERIKSLLSYDLHTDTYDYIVQNCRFTYSNYKFINEELLSYKFYQQEQGYVTVLYNYKKEILIRAEGLQGDIKTIQESICQKFLYVATTNSVNVYDKQNLNFPLQSYPVQEVYKIEEHEDCAVLLAKAQNSVKIIVVKTLSPIKKISNFTSSSFLMKYIFQILYSPESSQEDLMFAVNVYSVFKQNGFVDSYQNEQGESMLNILIEKHSSEVFAQLFLSENGITSYIRTFEGLSPLKQAYDLNKMSHVKIMLEYFAKNPSQVQLDHEDFLILFDIDIPTSKTILNTQFTDVATYKCTLPFQANRKSNLFISPVETEILGKTKVEELANSINNDPNGDSQLFSYSISHFKYNFTRGSLSSIAFLRAFSEEEDELVLRSKLRHIVNQKFEECMPILMFIAALFYAFLFSFMYGIYMNELSPTLRVVLIVFNTLFFLLEMKQLLFESIADYFTDFWNYIDLSVYMINYYLFIFSGERDQVIQFLFAFSAFLMLLRGMSYLRISGSLRYLINMVIEIMKDMAAFTVVLLYWIFGFSFIFYIFVVAASVAQKAELAAQGLPYEDDPEADSAMVATLKEIYRLSYGDFAPDAYSSSQWFIFIIATFFIPLVMFNLVIALMGDTFGRVKEASACVDMKEKAAMVLEVENMLNVRRVVLPDEEEEKLRNYVFIGFNTDLGEDDVQAQIGSEEEDFKNEVLNRLKDQEKRIVDLKDAIVSEITKKLKK